MKALLIALFAGGLLLAKQHESKIRAYLGIPVPGPVEEETRKEKKPDRKKGEDSTSESPANASDNNKSSQKMPTVTTTGRHDPIDVAIKEITEKRYPDITALSFEEAFPDITKLPLETFPEQITIKQALNLELRKDGILAGASVVNAGGKMRPLGFDENSNLSLVSIAHSELKGSLPLAKTDFEEKVREQYNLALAEANERLRAMREADASIFRKSKYLLRGPLQDSLIWSDSSDKAFEPVKAALELKTSDSGFVAMEFYKAPKESIRAGNVVGNYPANIVLLSGKDRGFGPYLWRAVAYTRAGKVVHWKDFPDETIQAARKALSR